MHTQQSTATHIPLNCSCRIPVVYVLKHDDVLDGIGAIKKSKGSKIYTLPSTNTHTHTYCLSLTHVHTPYTP